MRDEPAGRAASGWRSQAPVLLAVGLGGGAGALSRHGTNLLLGPVGGGFPWATLVKNVLGCLLIGILVVVIAEFGGVTHRLVRPFLGVGVLGGYTTFAGYAEDVRALAYDRAGLAAGVYLLGTLLGALLAVTAGVTATRALGRRWARRTARRRVAKRRAAQRRVTQRRAARGRAARLPRGGPGGPR